MKIFICTNLCLGTTRDLGPFYCPFYERVIESIIETSAKVDVTILFNDSHDLDDREFKYLPKHFVNGQVSTLRIPWIEKQIKSQFFFQRKSNHSAIRATHNRDVMLGFEPSHIILGGFSTSIDILATAFDVMALGLDLSFNPSACGDMNEDVNNKAIEHLEYIGVKRFE